MFAEELSDNSCLNGHNPKSQYERARDLLFFQHVHSEICMQVEESEELREHLHSRPRRGQQYNVAEGRQQC